VVVARADFGLAPPAQRWWLLIRAEAADDETRRHEWAALWTWVSDGCCE